MMSISKRNLSKKSRGQNQRRTLSPDDKEQSKLFIEKAREVGADEEKSAADELIGHLAKKPPEQQKKKAWEKRN
jgi:hypothetical protein